jgi:chitin synthase
VGTHDEDGFKQFQYALRKLEFPVDDIAQICQILATILHLGQLEFHTTSDTTPAANDSGGYSHEGGESLTRVSNPEALDPIAAFLGVSKQDLEDMFSYKTRTLHKERVTVMLDPTGAQNSADELARTLYALLVAWIIESINKRVCAAEEAIHNTVSIVDFPGFAKAASSSSQILDQLLNNAATEQLYNVTLTNFFERQVEMLDTEEVPIPATSYFDNSDAVRGLLKPGNGLLSILDDQAKRGKTDHQFLDAARRRFADKNPAIAIGSSTTVTLGSNFATHNAAAAFTVRHYAGEVDYPVDGLMDANTEVISGDMLNLIGRTRSHFVRELFGQEVLNKVVHPNEQNAVMQASIASKPTRMPSMARKKYDKQARAAARAVPEEETSDPESRTSTFVGGKGGKAADGAQPGVASQFLSSLQAITKSLTAPATNNYFVFCMKSNDKRMTHSFDVKSVRQQLQTFGIVEISQRIRNADFSIFLPFGEFLSRAEGDAIFVGSEREKCDDIITQRRWLGNEARCGVTGVFLSERCWFEITDISSVQLPPRTQYVDAETDDEGMTPGSRGFGGSNVHLVPGATPGGYYDDKHGNYFGVKDVDLKSDAGASAMNGDMFRNLETRSQMAEKANEKSQDVENVEEHQISGSRKRWMFFVYALTFYIPNFVIRWVGKKKRPDVQIAWREKLAINLLIWLSIAGVMFFMGECCYKETLTATC